ncbi:hypothetical protein [Streptomyces sp. NBC_00690]|uniref:hypothetical protein n=1 Tax=Streptomyces sp. NBC_00690 TaxID=2975808 RepID=UPI002E2A044C|nr:hypothetical protein [Streptomyces sp. NBC_00690]
MTADGILGNAWTSWPGGSQVGNLDQRVSNLDEKVGGLDDWIGGLDEKIDSLTGEVRDLNVKVDRNQAQIIELLSRLVGKDPDAG